MSSQPEMRIALHELRDNLAELINRALYHRERIIITRHGKDVAALVPVGDAPAEASPRETHPEYFTRR